MTKFDLDESIKQMYGKPEGVFQHYAALSWISMISFLRYPGYVFLFFVLLNYLSK